MLRSKSLGRRGQNLNKAFKVIKGLPIKIQGILKQGHLWRGSVVEC